MPWIIPLPPSESSARAYAGDVKKVHSHDFARYAMDWFIDSWVSHFWPSAQRVPEPCASASRAKPAARKKSLSSIFRTQRHWPDATPLRWWSTRARRDRAFFAIPPNIAPMHRHHRVDHRCKADWLGSSFARVARWNFGCNPTTTITIKCVRWVFCSSGQCTGQRVHA